LAKSTPVSAAASIVFEDECVVFFAEMGQLFGLPKSVGQIYGLLYVSPEPLGFSAIVERLEISKGSASQGLQLLRSLGAINEADISSTLTDELGSSHRVAYEPELSLRQLVAGIISERIAPMAKAGADRLKDLKRLAAQSPAHSEFYLERVNQLTTWRHRFNTVVPLLSALLGPNKKKKR
jgi:DNA-binding transcriptional regulator GbsR (MarR family)